MNRDDAIRMARESGLHSAVLLHLYAGREAALTDSECDELRRLERFAHLVYESVFRDANIAASRTILDAAVLEEREACAKVCESVMPNPVQNWADAQIVNALRDCAAAIRARRD